MIGDAQRVDNGRAIDDGNHHDKEQHEADNAPRFYGHQAEEYQRQADIAHAHEPHPCKSLRVTGAGNRGAEADGTGNGRYQSKDAHQEDSYSEQAAEPEQDRACIESRIALNDHVTYLSQANLVQNTLNLISQLAPGFKIDEMTYAWKGSPVSFAACIVEAFDGDGGW